MLNCTTNRYDRLYARWLGHPEKLLIRGKLAAGERVLDLCGGTGAVAVEALRMGAGRAVLLDLNPRCPDDRVTQVKGRAEEANRLVPLVFDLIVCRQAIGYLDLPAVAKALRWLLADKGRGRLVFNNFVRPKWNWQTYEFKGRSFLEASAYFGRSVFHLQASPFLGFDVTRFRWYTEDDVRAAFCNYKIESWRSGPTIYYRMS